MLQPRTKASHGDNAFDLIRVLLAALVVYTHGRLLGGFKEDWLSVAIKHQTDPGRAAVWGFFGVSGFLISRSYCLTPEWRTFLKKRALRILPGYYLAIVFSAFVAAPLLVQINVTGSGSWHFRDAAAFIGRNALLQIHAWTVGNETQGLPYSGSIDGSLWSLFPEACCYVMILLLGVAGALSRRRYELLGITLFLFVTNFSHCMFPEVTVPLLPSILVLTSNTPVFLAFAVGATVQSFGASIDLGRNGALVAGILCLVLLKFGGWAIFGPVSLPLFILNLAYSFRVRLAADLSYGIYVLHFPCLQLLAACNVQRYGFALYLLCAALACSALACASWFLVERPALRLK
jgi:peptidoglycan/LPS O-acetylase OafA/YrhL